MANGLYSIAVTVTSYLGSSSSRTLTFTKRPSGTAPVVVPTTGTIQFVIGEGVKVATQLVASSVCAGSKVGTPAMLLHMQLCVNYCYNCTMPVTAQCRVAGIACVDCYQTKVCAAVRYVIRCFVDVLQVVYSWTSLDGWAAVPANYQLKDLVIPGPVPGVSAGEQKTVQLAVSFENSAVVARSNVTLEAVGSALVARLKGPSGEVPNTRTIVLSAAGSFDPDDPEHSRPLATSWECIRADYPAPCFTGINNYGVQSGMNWTLSAGLLAAEIEHTFKVTIMRTFSNGTAIPGQAAVASVTFKPTAAQVPTGRIRRVCGAAGCPLRHAADDALVLTMALDAGAEAATVAWSTEQNSNVVGQGQDFKISPGDLPSTGFVTIKAVVALNGVQSTTKLTIPINGKPVCADTCLTVDPAAGVFPIAHFTAQAVGFSDDQPGMR